MASTNNLDDANESDWRESDWLDMYERLDDGDVDEDSLLCVLDEMMGGASTQMNRFQFTHRDPTDPVTVSIDESKRATWDMAKDMITATR